MAQVQPFQPTGHCIVSTIVELRRRLIEALGQEGSLTIDLSAVASLDVTFIQLLVSASKTATLSGRHLVIRAVSEVFDAQFRAVGVVVDAHSGELIY